MCVRFAANSKLHLLNELKQRKYENNFRIGYHDTQFNVYWLYYVFQILSVVQII